MKKKIKDIIGLVIIFILFIAVIIAAYFVCYQIELGNEYKYFVGQFNEKTTY